MGQKMLFIYPDSGGFTISFSPAIEILSAFLKQNGISVELIHIHNTQATPYDLPKITDKVREISPDVIGISATSFQYSQSNEIAGFLKKEGIDVPVILGGIHEHQA